MSRVNVTTRSLFFAGCIFWGLSCSLAYGTDEKTASETITAGMKLPQITLDAPASEKDVKYLALKDSKPFSLSQIPARLIVLEILSVYCKHCPKQAPKLNRIYKLIQQDADLSHDIKMIGIAVGDQRKVAKWKAKLHVPFPLFVDAKGAKWERLGKPGVPLTLLVTNNGKILSTHPGVTKDIDEFFRHIKKVFKQQ